MWKKLFALAAAMALALTFALAEEELPATETDLTAAGPALEEANDGAAAEDSTGPEAEIVDDAAPEEASEAAPLPEAEMEDAAVSEAAFSASDAETSGDEARGAKEEGKGEAASGEADGDSNAAAVPDHLTTTISSEAVCGDATYTVILQHMAEDGSEGVLQTIVDSISVIIDENGYLKAVGSVTDAEKFDNHRPGYDWDLCWAAGAANTLWLGGYAQNAVNPDTGAAFQSEDEVFDYFRSLFTDQGGRPDGGWEVFLDGTYPYEDLIGFAQLEDGAAAEELVPDISAGDAVTVSSLFHDQYENISALEDMDDSVHALHIGYYETDGTVVNRHTVTMVGLILDDAELKAENRYKGIVLADSDNDCVYGDPSIPDADKAKLAADAVNSWTAYPMQLVNLGRSIGTFWQINGYSEGYYTLLEEIFSLKKASAKAAADTPEETTEETAEERTDVTASAAPKTSSLLKGYDFRDLMNRMREEELTLYSPTDWQYALEAGERFDVFARTYQSMILNVYLDDVLLTERTGAFQYAMTPNGITLISFDPAYMDSLGDGEHTLRVELRNVGFVTATITISAREA